MLKDNEAEVRTAGAGQIPGFAKLLDRDVILARILPCVRDLSTDSSQHVRAALATEISGLAPLLGKDATTEHLLPLFLKLLKDEFSEVRLHLIGKLDMVNEGECYFCKPLYADVCSHWHPAARASSPTGYHGARRGQAMARPPSDH